MLSDNTKTFAKHLRLQHKSFAAVAALIALVSGALCLAPPDWLKRVGIAQFAQDHRIALTAAMLVSVAVLITLGVQMVHRIGEQSEDHRDPEERILKYLLSITEEEKRILRLYVSHQTRTYSLPIEDGAVQGLIAAGIIQPAGVNESAQDGRSFSISPVALEFLQISSALLEDDTSLVRTG